MNTCPMNYCDGSNLKTTEQAAHRCQHGVPCRHATDHYGHVLWVPDCVQCAATLGAIATAILHARHAQAR